MDLRNTNKRYKIDGYCHELHLAIEIDEKYHLHTGIAIKDKEREEEITKVIGCTFLRISLPI